MTTQNILLLGETGVGKSLWINSFFNYLSFTTLDDAIASDNLCIPIPIQFNMTNSNFEEVTVSLGERSNNENIFSTGESATQGAVIYTYHNNATDTTINLIDTPGMGDTRGVIKDAGNMSNIMSVIRPLEKLHGICILLKPNEARLTLSFRFCIQELLCHLHKETIRNIVFCFTNTRSNFYRPGESIKTLRNLVENNLPKRSRDEIDLNNKTVFCFDSESFRYIAAVKSGIQFEADEACNYSQSWDKSSNEARRMVEQIKILPPHSVTKTIDLFKVRQTVQAITKPVIDICIAIEVKLEDIQTSKATIEKLRAETTAMTKDLRKVTSSVTRTGLNHLRVVCAEISCTEVVSNQDGKQDIHYKSVCHDPCECAAVDKHVIGIQNEAGLLKCSVMAADGTCTVCQHPWQVHIFVNFDATKDRTKQLDYNVGGKMLLGLGTMLWKEVGIVDIRKDMESLKDEKMKIQEVAAKLSYALMVNAVDDDNDAMGEYLDHLIKVEKDKGNIDVDNKHLADLLEMKKIYDLKLDMLHHESTDGVQIDDLTSDQVDDAVDQLIQLRFSGDMIRKSLNEVNISCGGKVRTGVTNDNDKCMVM